MECQASCSPPFVSHRDAANEPRCRPSNSCPSLLDVLDPAVFRPWAPNLTPSSPTGSAVSRGRFWATVARAQSPDRLAADIPRTAVYVRAPSRAMATAGVSGDFIPVCHIAQTPRLPIKTSSSLAIMTLEIVDHSPSLSRFPSGSFVCRLDHFCSHHSFIGSKCRIHSLPPM